MKSFLALDFGAGSLKLAEFEVGEAGGLRLKQFGIQPLGAEGAQESTRAAAVEKGLQLLLAQKNFSSKTANVCAPGFHVFSKFVKLPPVDTSKVTQIIQYEAQQNVPFPLEQVVWDYQILGTSPTGELEVLLVAIKTDVVDGLFRVSDGAGLRLQLVDVSPAALCNAFRFNYGDLEGCTMLLDIGAKTSNLLFFEKGKIYARSINVGANSITQDFANESKLPFPEAERLKVAEGFVSLGGAYEEPDSPTQAAISKISRQVMTRLHIQVNQTIQFYRGQQGGSAPQRLYLSGGGSILPYTAQFFAEKLNVPVEYFNPFRNVDIDSASVAVEELEKVAHSFGEVVGLGLRNLAHCPIELNLMPKTSLQRQELSQKKPYLIAAVFSLVLVVFGLGLFFQKVSAIKQDKAAELSGKSAPLASKESDLTRAKEAVDKLRKDANEVTALIDRRFFWAELIPEFRNVLQTTELRAKEKLAQQNPKAEVGLWIEMFMPMLPESAGYVVAGEDDQEISAMDKMFMDRYGLKAEDLGRGAPKTDSGNSVTTIQLVFRGVNLSWISPTANSEVAYALKYELQSRTNVFVPESVTLKSLEETDPLTFRFNMGLKLQRPFKF